ncbi:hypothetical protein BRD16_01230 [Halobacteriales archaeon SW_6_65_46]|nr:MAG: hypothetical protein BRD16_01230 [Halobacteriales archaeon SW_6_65_46]
MPEATARERVTARLAQLRGSYDGFDIRQTTVTVSPAEFAEIVDDEETVLAEIRVENEAGDRLLVDGPGGWQPPTTTVSTGQPLSETIRETVARRTGVVPDIVSLDEAAIVAVGCAASGDEAYQLQLRFLAAPDRGEPRPPAAWRES